MYTLDLPDNDRLRTNGAPDIETDDFDGTESPLVAIVPRDGRPPQPMVRPLDSVHQADRRGVHTDARGADHQDAVFDDHDPSRGRGGQRMVEVCRFERALGRSGSPPSTWCSPKRRPR